MRKESLSLKIEGKRKGLLTLPEKVSKMKGIVLSILLKRRKSLAVWNEKAYNDNVGQRRGIYEKCENGRHRRGLWCIH